MASVSAEERLGQQLGGRYRLDSILSEGGMGVLFRALDLPSQRAVAIKMLKPAHACAPDRVARFEREIRIASSIHHPHVAQVHGAGTDTVGARFLVLELLEGRSLAEELSVRPTLPLAEALRIVLPIAAALAAAHANGIVHRDVKPANIFLAQSEHGIVPKLLDFGIAISTKDEFETQTGVFVGTPGYVAPEQVLHNAAGPFTDVWGLAAVLHRCLLGFAPHCGGAALDVLHKVANERVPTVASPHLAKSICASLDRALSRDPLRRFRTMHDFARALERDAGLALGESTMAVTKAAPLLERPESAAGAPRLVLALNFLSAAALLVGLASAWKTLPSQAVQAPSAPSEHHAHAAPLASNAHASNAEPSSSRTPNTEPQGPSTPTQDDGLRLVSPNPAPPPALRALGAARGARRVRTERERTTGLPIVTAW